MDKFIKLFILLPPDDIVEFMKDAINNSHKERVQMLNAAIKMKMDPNAIVNTYGIPLLHHAIFRNDIPIVCSLVLHGAEIYKKDDDGFTALHICAKAGNAILLKFFIDKILKSNDEKFYYSKINEKDVDGNTSLFIACYFGHDQCVKILVDNGADINITNKYKQTSFQLIFDYFEYLIENKCYHMSVHHYHNECHHDNKNNNTELYDNDYIKKYIRMMEIITPKKTDLLAKEMAKIKEICLKGHSYLKDYSVEIIKILCSNIPEIINLACDKYKNTLLHHAIMLQDDIFIEFFLALPKINLSIVNRYNISYLHLAAKYGRLDFVKAICEKYPDIKDIVCYHGRTAIEHAMLPTGINTRKTDTDIIKIIEYLIGIGVNINSYNHFGARALETAIQYCSTEIINIVLKDTDFTLRPTKTSKVNYPIRNNDPIGYAVQLGRLDVVKFLIDKNAPLRTFVIKYYTSDDTKILYPIPTVLTIAIMYKRHNILKYLLELNTIKEHLNSFTKKFLLQTAISENCQNIHILEHFITYDNYFTKIVHLNDMQISKIKHNFFRRIFKKINNTTVDAYEKILRRHIDDYDNKKRYMMSGLMLMLSILSNIYDDKSYVKNKNKKHKCPNYIENKICKIFSEIDVLYDSVDSRINDLEDIYTIASEMIDHIRVEDLRFCMEYIIELQNTTCEMYAIKKSIDMLSVLSLARKSSKIKKSLTIIETFLDFYTEKEKDTIEYDSDFDEGYDSDRIEYDSDNDVEYSESDDDESKCSCCNKKYSDLHEKFDGENFIFKPITDNDNDTEIEFDTSKYDNLDLRDEDFNDINEKCIGVNEKTTEEDIDDTNNQNHVQEVINTNQTIKKIKLTNENFNTVDKLLIKLKEPIKMANYDLLYNHLTKLQNTYQITDNNIIVYDTDSKRKNIVAVVNKINNSKSDFLNPCTKPQARSQPIKWIKYYGPNIGISRKTDSNHMFPFILDWLLSKWSCIERRVRDPTATKPIFGGTSYLLYFHGSLLLEDKMVEGCFEYFINGNGTIFHRLFRPIDDVPIKVRNVINML